MEIKALIYILLTGIFVNNYVLQKFLGVIEDVEEFESEYYETTTVPANV
mgnify:CR=1 FL=1